MTYDVLEHASTVEIIQKAVVGYLSDEGLDGVTADTPQVRSMAERFGSQIVQVLRIPGNSLFEKSYPSTWWDAVKARWFPQWAKDRWPITYETVTIKALYPKLALPNEPISWDAGVRIWRDVPET